MEPKKKKGSSNLIAMGGAFIQECHGVMTFQYDVLYGTFIITCAINRRKISFEFLQKSRLPVVELEDYEPGNRLVLLLKLFL